MRTRPAAKITIPVLIGILSGHYLNLNIFAGLILLAMFVLTLVIIITRFYRQVLIFDIILLLSLVLLGFLRYEQKTQNRPVNSIEKFGNLTKPITLYGKVVKAADIRPTRLMVTVQADSLVYDSLSVTVTGHAMVSLREFQQEPEYGDLVTVQGYLRIPAGPRNPGEFNYQKYLAASDITTILNVYHSENFSILSSGHGNWLFQTLVYPVRAFILQTIDKYLEGEPGALLKGLLVGARGEIPYELLEAFSKTGVIHVLAVSGLHVGFILLIFLSVFSLLRLPKVWQVGFTILGLMIYVFLTEAKPPVMRASIMATFILIGTVLQRRSDIYNNLSIAALVILLLDPGDLFEAGFQLSFMAVLAIAFLYNRIKTIMNATFTKLTEQDNAIIKYVYDLFFVSLAAQLGTLPLIVYYFYRIPIVSIVANLVVVPCVGLIVALGFVSMVFAAVFPPLALIYANANWLLLTVLIAAVRWGANLPFSYVNFTVPTITHVLIYYFFIGFLFAANSVKLRKWSFMGMLILGNGIIWHNNFFQHKELEIIFFDVGQGDSALIKFPDGKILLVDAGEQDEMFDVGARIIAPYLHRNGYRKIDAILVTHPHNDHLGGVPYLMQHFNVGRIIDSGYTYSSDQYKKYRILADSLKIPVTIPVAGDTLAGFGNVMICVLNPTAEFTQVYSESGGEVNNSSIVIKLIYGTTSFLLTGDAEVEAENSMLAFDTLLKSDVIKVGHHGSITSSSLPFIKKVNPQYAIVSVGAFNQLQLPSQERLDQMRRNNIVVFRTDSTKAVVFRSNGKNIRLINWK